MGHKITQLKPFGILLKPDYSHDNLHVIDIANLKALARREHLIVLRKCFSFNSIKTFAEYCEQWGQISLWPFGKVLELIEQENPQDHIFDNSYIPLHWDGMYRQHIPEFQIFNCVTAPLPGQGGRTTFSNTILALNNASTQSKTIWKSINGCYQRKMEFYQSKTISPIMTKHPFNDELVIRYNEPPAQAKGRFINPPELEFTGVALEQLNSFHDDIQASLYDPTNFYAHEWQTGDVVIADNFSLLHGREKFISKSPRHLQRVHILSDPPYVNPGLVSTI
jgi:alpha-ketoglutarate-dependent taurine dioxygenase